METPESLTHSGRLKPGYRCIDIGTQVTLPTHLLIEHILGIRDRYYTDDKTLADKLQAADPQRQLIHIQVLPVTAERKEELYGIWRIEEWTSNYETYLENKAKAEEENKKYFKRKENIQKLTLALCEKIGLDLEQAETLAAKLYDNKQVAIIAQYCAEVEI